MKKVLLSLLCLFGISAMAYADTASFGVGEIKGGTGSSNPVPFVCTKAPVSISVTSTNGSASAGLGSYSYIRLYGTSTVAISCTSGYKIDKVEFSVENLTKNNAFSDDSNYTLEGCALSNSGTTYTLTPTTGNERYIEFKVTAQLRLGSNIVVTYSSTGTAGEDPEPGTDPEPGEDPQPGYTLVGEGTLAVPYTVADALYLIAQGQATTSNVYVAGKISSIKSVDTGTYGNAEYNIVDEGQTETLTVYRGYYSNNAANKKFTSEDQIAVGDAVVLCGVLKDYNGTSELTNSYIVTLNGASTEPEQGGEDPGTDPEQPGEKDANKAEFYASKVASNAAATLQVNGISSESDVAVAIEDVVALAYRGTAPGSDMRVYKNKTLTLTPAAGVTLTKVEFTTTQYGFGKLDGLTVNGKNATWEGTSASTLTFTASGQQTRVTNIVITFTKGGVTPDPDPDPQDPETPEDPEGTATYDFTFAAASDLASGETKPLGDADWYAEWNNTNGGNVANGYQKGVYQFGASKNPADMLKLVTESFEGYNIVSVSVSARTSATTGTIAYTLGETEVYNQEIAKNSNLADFTWTPAAPVQDADPLTIEMTATAGAAAFFVGNINVKYLVPELPEALTDDHVTTFVNGVAKDFATISSEDLTIGTKLKVRTVPGIEIYYQIYDPAAAETSANGPARVATASEETYDLTDSSWNKHTGHVYTYTVDENLQGKQLIVVASHPNTGEQVVKGLSVGSDGTVTGIDAIIANANAQVEYFNLQGQRVANPQGGIFIRRQGTTVTKVVR